jgi:hypothetical protein
MRPSSASAAAVGPGARNCARPDVAPFTALGARFLVGNDDTSITAAASDCLVATGATEATGE